MHLRTSTPIGWFDNEESEKYCVKLSVRCIKWKEWLTYAQVLFIARDLPDILLHLKDLDSIIFTGELYGDEPTIRFHPDPL